MKWKVSQIVTLAKSNRKIAKMCKKNAQESAVDFTGPFQNANKANRYLIVSIHHFNGWPEAKFLRKPDTDKVIAFLKRIYSKTWNSANNKDKPSHYL